MLFNRISTKLIRAWHYVFLFQQIAVWEHVLHVVTMIGVLTNTSLMVSTNSVFHVLRESYAEHAALASLGAFVVWERVMVSIKYLMQFLTSEKSPELINRLKDEKRKKDEKLRDEVMDRSKNPNRKLSNGTQSTSSGMICASPSPQKLSKDAKPQGSIRNLDVASTGECSPLLEHRMSRGDGIESSSPTPRRRTRSTSKKTVHKPIFSTSKKWPAVNARSTTHSPFSQYVQHETFSSPVNTGGVSDDEGLSEMLSIDSSSLDDDSCNGYRTPLKPSMQRSMKIGNRKSELDAADERIRNRMNLTSGKKKKW